jgi:hypothetical protein
MIILVFPTSGFDDFSLGHTASSRRPRCVRARLSASYAWLSRDGLRCAHFPLARRIGAMRGAAALSRSTPVGKSPTIMRFAKILLLKAALRMIAFGRRDCAR